MTRLIGSRVALAFGYGKDAPAGTKPLPPFAPVIGSNPRPDDTVVLFDECGLVPEPLWKLLADCATQPTTHKASIHDKAMDILINRMTAEHFIPRTPKSQTAVARVWIATGAAVEVLGPYPWYLFWDMADAETRLLASYWRE